MRVFDDLETSVIERIVEGKGYSRNLINLLDSKSNLQRIRVKLNKDEKTLTYLFEREHTEPQYEGVLTIIEDEERLSEFLIKHVVLIQYLEKHDYITIFERLSKTDGIWEFGEGSKNRPYTETEFNDLQIIELLARYIDKEILPSPALKELYRNDFKTDDEIRFKKQNTSAWAAIILSAILGACGIVNNQASNKSQDVKFDKQLKQNSESTSKIIEALNNLSYSQSNINKINEDSVADIKKLIETIKIDLNNLQNIIEDQERSKVKNIHVSFQAGENKI